MRQRPGNRDASAVARLMGGGTIGAVDIGATKVMVGLADTDGHLLPGRIARFQTPDEPAALVDMLAAALGELGPTPSILSCAAPGPLDADAGVLVNLHNRRWTGIPLSQLLSARLKIPVLLEDDATMAALGEAVVGAGAGCDPVAYLTVSSGVGAGIVTGGRPLRGAHGLAGEIGHLVIDPAGPACGCGRRGDIESYAGGLCLARRATEQWPNRQLADGAPSPRTVAELFALAHRGDPHAVLLTEAACHALARGIATLAAVIDPERIVIGGSIAIAQPNWVATIAIDARQLCMAETGAAIEIAPAALKERSALAGAALLGAAKR